MHGKRDSNEPEPEKLEELVRLTEEAMSVADEIGRPVSRAAYHLEAARLEAEHVAGHPQSLTPRGSREGEASDDDRPPAPDVA